MAVGKANAYGHGLVPTALALADADAFAVARLDDLANELLVSAVRLHSDAVSALYSFALQDGERLVAQGRLSLLHGPIVSPDPSSPSASSAR